MMKGTIIGREIEQNVLTDIFKSQRAEFVAVYGRRRVGKTYLIEQFCKKQACLFFCITGLHKGTLKKQLDIFTESISKTFFVGTDLQIARPTNWMQAFAWLTNAIKKFSMHKKIVLFFDELPWLASKRSGFKQALDRYWNTTWSKDNKIILIICGSAASWMIKNIINDKGGLHNRITVQLPLYPFSLKETSDYLNYVGNKFNRRQVLELYLVLGGIPHYLEKVKANLSAAQNISRLCFTRSGQLFNEFDKLFASLFDHADVYVELIRIIASKRNGIERAALEAAARSSTTGGTLTERLIALEEAGFIKSFVPIGYAERGVYYKLIDEYCLFYLTWIKPVKRQLANETDSGYWLSKMISPAWKSWAGYAFEAVCLKHVSQIKKALFIPAGALSGSWSYRANSREENGAQVDLLFDRDDGVISLCEIKYHQRSFAIDKKYAATLQRKIEVFREQSGINKQIFLSMITVDALKKNQYSEELIRSKATLEDLFEDAAN